MIINRNCSSCSSSSSNIRSWNVWYRIIHVYWWWSAASCCWRKDLSARSFLPFQNFHLFHAFQRCHLNWIKRFLLSLYYWSTVTLSLLNGICCGLLQLTHEPLPPYLPLSVHGSEWMDVATESIEIADIIDILCSFHHFIQMIQKLDMKTVWLPES